MEPSDFTKKQPFGSVFQKSEHETIAMNVMVILKRTGDKFRKLSWREYKTERLKDGNFSEGEKSFFEAVAPYCTSASKAKLFGPSWNELTTP